MKLYLLILYIFNRSIEEIKTRCTELIGKLCFDEVEAEKAGRNEKKNTINKFDSKKGRKNNTVSTKSELSKTNRRANVDISKSMNSKNRNNSKKHLDQDLSESNNIVEEKKLLSKKRKR